MIGPTIGASGNTQILVATKPVDFRNYAERTIMQSSLAGDARVSMLSTV
jgi:hypothetical protein